MKIKCKEMSWEQVQALPERPHKKIGHQSPFFRWLLRTVSAGELKAVGFTCTQENMERLGAQEPALYLMNHSSFTDLQIAAELLHDREYHIVCTVDGFVGKEGLMRAIGCIPTQKFVMDLNLVRDMKYCAEELKSSILLYPEASYSFDGTETPLPASLGKFLKFLKIPVVMIRTEGAFLRDPLYNLLQKREVNVSARMTYLLSPEEIREKSTEELNRILKEAFTYDHFREQAEKNIVIDEEFRADGLERALFRCASCGREKKMRGKGTSITCGHCGKSWELLENGRLSAVGAETEYEYVSDWYRWEREEIRKELERGEYGMKCDVDIVVLKDLKSVYKVGEGTLTHDAGGFRLTGCDGKLTCEKRPLDTYSLYADYYWYERGDVIAIGDSKITYYCFPKGEDAPPVARARLAAEELYRMKKK